MKGVQFFELAPKLPQKTLGFVNCFIKILLEEEIQQKKKQT